MFRTESDMRNMRRAQGRRGEYKRQGPSSRRFVALAQQLWGEQVHCAILEPEAQPDLVARLCPACQRVALDPLGRDVRPRGQGDDYSRWLSDRVAATFADCLAPSP